MHYHVELTREKFNIDCDDVSIRVRLWHSFDLRCFFIVEVVESLVTVEWSINLRHSLQEILECLFKVETTWVNRFHVFEPAVAFAFLYHRESFIFDFELFKHFCSKWVCLHHSSNTTLVETLQVTYWSLCRKIKLEKFCLIFSIASWRILLLFDLSMLKESHSSWLTDWLRRTLLDRDSIILTSSRSRSIVVSKFIELDAFEVKNDILQQKILRVTTLLL